jgi:hypothetical protein
VPAELALCEGNDDLPRDLERLITLRTWGRLRRLAVELNADCVTVRGHAPSYYVKQLAIQAYLEAASAAPMPRLDLDIVVAPPVPLPA